MKSEATVFKMGARNISDRDIEGIVEVTRLCGGLSREELAHTICEHLEWVTASGSHKTKACLKLMEKLEESGTIHLPSKQEHQKRGPRKPITPTSRTAPREEIRSELSAIGEVGLPSRFPARCGCLGPDYWDSWGCREERKQLNDMLL